MNVNTANAIYDILVEECEAKEDLRSQFVSAQTERFCDSYDFADVLYCPGYCVSLIFRRSVQSWEVDSFISETNEGPEFDLVREMIDIADFRLKKLREGPKPKNFELPQALVNPTIELEQAQRNKKLADLALSSQQDLSDHEKRILELERKIALLKNNLKGASIVYEYLGRRLSNLEKVALVAPNKNEFK